jgi:hypothetical protein
LLSTGDLTGNFDIQTGVLTDGPHTITARITDQAGNQSVVSTNPFALIEDATVPSAIATLTALSADIGTSTTDFITNTASQTVSGIVLLALEAGEKVQMSTDGGINWLAACRT